jgi:hypothetical protein
MPRLAIITYLDGAGDAGGPVDPGYGRPATPGRPDNSLPAGPPGSIATLPVFPFDPTIDNSLPGQGGRPDNSLPGMPGVPPTPGNALPGGVLRPGVKLVVKWLACTGLILVPDNSLPSTAEPR